MKYLKLFTDNAESLKMLDDDDFKSFVLALFAYAATDTPPEITGNGRFLWPFFQQQIDRERDAYNTKVSNAKRALDARSKGDRSDAEEDGMSTEKTVRLTERNDSVTKSSEDKEKEKDKNKEKEKDNKTDRGALAQRYRLEPDRWPAPETMTQKAPAPEAAPRKELTLEERQAIAEQCFAFARKGAARHDMNRL